MITFFPLTYTDVYDYVRCYLFCSISWKTNVVGVFPLLAPFRFHQYNFSFQTPEGLVFLVHQRPTGRLCLKYVLTIVDMVNKVVLYTCVTATMTHAFVTQLCVL